MTRRLFAALIALSLLSATQASAQPGPLVNQLMQSPVTLFSFGMLRLQLMLDDIARELTASDMIGIADYDWDANRIHLDADIRHPRPSRTACAEVLALLRSRGQVHTTRDDTYTPADRAGSAYAALFKHIGFTEERLPRDLETRLDAIFVLRATLYALDAPFPSDPVVRCESRLMKPSEISYRD